MDKTSLGDRMKSNSYFTENHLLEDIISGMTIDEIDITLALLHRRVCAIRDEEVEASLENEQELQQCKDCYWAGSFLCIPIHQYLKAKYKKGD